MKTIIAAALAILLAFTSAVRLQQHGATRSQTDNSKECCVQWSQGGDKSPHVCVKFGPCPVKTETIQKDCGKTQYLEVNIDEEFTLPSDAEISWARFGNWNVID